MKPITFERKKHPILTALFLSLVVHLAAGILLLSSLSNHSVSSPELSGIKLVWISFDDKKEMSKVEIKNNRLDKHPSFIKAAYSEPTGAETPSHHQENVQIPAVATTSLAENKISTRNEWSGGFVSKEKYYNAKVSSKDEAAGINSPSNTVIAYPLYKENSPPVYPEIARARGYEGIVLVSAEILPNGRVGEVKIRKSSGYAILDQSAIQAVKPWKFEPAKKSGSPFTAWVELPIKFILNNNSQS